MFNLNDMYYAASVLGVTFDRFPPEDFLSGMNVELEHGLINPRTNITNNDVVNIIYLFLAFLILYLLDYCNNHWF